MNPELDKTVRYCMVSPVDEKEKEILLTTLANIVQTLNDINRNLEQLYLNFMLKNE